MQTNNWLLIGQDSSAKLETRPKGSSPYLTSFSCLFKQTISWTQGNCQQQFGKLGIIRETRRFTDFRGDFRRVDGFSLVGRNQKLKKKPSPSEVQMIRFSCFFILWVCYLPHEQHRYYQHHGPEKEHKTRKFKLEWCRIHRVEDKSTKKITQGFQRCGGRKQCPWKWEYNTLLLLKVKKRNELKGALSRRYCC